VSTRQVSVTFGNSDRSKKSLGSSKNTLGPGNGHVNTVGSWLGTVQPVELHDRRRDVATCLDKLWFSVLKSKRALAPGPGRVRVDGAAAVPKTKANAPDSPLPQTRAACRKLQGR
jgi:hypothetical protein